MPAQQDALAVTLAIILALAVALLSGLAGAGVFGSPQTSGATPDPACAEWTDGCVICARRPEGLACSTPGIACTRGRIECLRR